jgi:hypothetical protein
MVFTGLCFVILDGLRNEVSTINSKKIQNIFIFSREKTVKNMKNFFKNSIFSYFWAQICRISMQLTPVNLI